MSTDAEGAGAVRAGCSPPEWPIWFFSTNPGGFHLLIVTAIQIMLFIRGRALSVVTSVREDCFGIRLTTEMTSNPKQVSSGRLFCLKNQTCFVLNFTAFALLGSFPAKTLGFLSKLVLLECVWVYQVFMYVGHLFLPMSNRSEHVCEWLEMHGHELKPNGFSPKTISNELGEEKIINQNQTKPKNKKQNQQTKPKKEIDSKENET